MGKKGSWFSAIKRVFTPNSKEKLDKVSDNKSADLKKKGRGVLGHGETKSFIPFFRQPSSIEKILEEADQQNLFKKANSSTFFEQPQPPPSLPLRPPSPIVASPRAISPPVSSPQVIPQYEEVNHRPKQNQRDPQLSAIKIQAAYRGYMQRRSFRTLKSLVRLQQVVKGKNVKRQTNHAIKQMQLLVRVQTQIQTRRIQMLENQAPQTQSYNNDKESETTVSKLSFNQLSEAGNREEWDASLLKREEAEAKMQRRAEAVMKRKRAMAYGYSNQLWKANPKSAQTNPTDTRPSGSPWWWNRLERDLPSSNQTQPSKAIHQTPPRQTPNQKPTQQSQSSVGFDHHESITPRSAKSTQSTPPFSNWLERKLPSSNQTQPSKIIHHTPPRQTPNQKPIQQPHSSIRFDHHESITPRSAKSTQSTPPLSITRKPLTPSSKTPSRSSNNLTKYSRPRTLDALMKDDDSLVSCPPFSVPNYMAPTVSAKAKARANSEPKRRFSLPLSSNIGSFKWNNKGSSKGSSVDSVTSMPVAFGRKPFNRYV